MTGFGSRLLIVVLATIALVGTWLASVYGEDVPIAIGRVSWHSYTNPSRGKDVPYSVCGYGDWIYTVGSEAGDQGMPIPRIEKRLKSNGSLFAVWRGKDVFGEFKDCIVFDGRLYAVGYVELEYGVRTWIIAVFDGDLVPLDISVRREYRYWSEAIAVSTFRDSIYVAGFVGIDPGDVQWRVEKISPNLTPISVYDANPSNMYDILTCFDLNPVTGDLWIAGVNGLTGSWRIDVLDENLNRKYLFEKEMPGYGLPNAIAFDENGFAYIAGAGIAIFDNRTELLQVTTTFGYCPKIAYLDGIIYLFCTSLLGGYNRHVLYIVDKQSFIAFTSIMSSDIDAYAYFTSGRVHLDGRRLYISGYIELEDSGGWIVYSVEGAPNQIPIEYVVTEPYTTTITMTISFRDLVEQIKKEASSSATTSETLPQVHPVSQVEEVEQKPSIDIKTVLLIILFITISLVLIISLIARKRQ